MAIMLRYIGIPSRLVNGFRAGEYNRIGNDWIVRQYHAHSWIETYIPPYGWMEFDPTPVEQQYPQPAVVRLWTGIVDAVDLWWWERIVNYNSFRQYNVLASLYSASGSILNSVSDFYTRVYNKGRGGLAWFVSSERISTIGRVRYWGIPLFAIIVG